MESSYREQLQKLENTKREKPQTRSNLKKIEPEEIGTVLKSTMTILRRHNVTGTLCPCGIDDPEEFTVTKVDQAGFITEVKCKSCSEKSSAICRNQRCRYESIEDPSTLRPGDHISWHRPYLIWHHAVVMKQQPNDKKITVHEYTSSDGPYAAIKETTFDYPKCVSGQSGALFRVVYDDSYTDEYVMLRATKTDGERKYDIFEQNCEHSARWCKTGIHESVQMEACFTTAWKAALVVCLRLISLIVLWLLQLSEPQDEKSRKLERVVSVVYMAAIGFLFFLYSLYLGCREIRPKVPVEHHDTDVCGIEEVRRRCADVTYKKCCCRQCGGAVMGVCFASCFLCSLFDACCSVCRKNVQCRRNMICRRRPSIVIGLTVRIFFREVIAAAGPLLVVYFEEEIVSQLGTTAEKLVVIILAILGASLASYVIGALVGVWIEASIIACAKCCCNRSTLDCDRGNPDESPERVGEEEVAIQLTNTHD